MGISQLWQILEGGKRRYSLEELASESKTRLRVAIDVAIWGFQARAHNSGDNPELLVLFFRLCRLFELGIRPVFVFDGAERPSFKRNKTINTIPLEIQFQKNLIKLIELFGFAVWHAYGEAEAECAMLQRLGFVDIVLTNDSDVFLFGATRVIRQWMSKKDEEIDCYDMAWIRDATGLDRSDLILIGLLRGNDYDKGSNGVGIHIAEGLARSHHHHTLMNAIALAPSDTPLEDAMVQLMYDNLTYELQNNTSNHLKKKHPNLTLDPKFPDFSIAIDFIRPITNIQTKRSAALAKVMKQRLDCNAEPNWGQLAMFVQRMFQWPNENLIRRFGSLLFPAFMRKQLGKKAQPQRNINLKEKHHEHGQTHLKEYYKPTALHINTENKDIIKISDTKSIGRRRYYRVEWDPQCWSRFKEKLSTMLDRTIHSEKPNDPPAEDPWPMIKRQWVAADLVFIAHRSMAIDFQSKKSKNKESFLILPERIKK